MSSSENNNKSKKQKDHLQYFRYAVLSFFLLFLTWMGYRHQLLGGGPAGSPTVDALCPFGGLESIYSWLKEGYWLRRIALSSFVLFIGVTIATLLTGRVFCGWICPLGAVNEFVSAGSRKLGIKKIKLPPAVDKYLRYLKYLILLLIIYTTWKFGTLTFRDYDPWAAWMHLSAGWSEFGYGTAVLFATLFAGVFIERFWCRYLCPLGAFLAFVSKFSLVKVYRDQSPCINCGKCAVVCPVGLTPDKDIVQGNGECITCGKCYSACPVDEAMNSGYKSKNLTFLKTSLAGLLIFAAVVAGAKTIGYWETYASAPPATGVKSVDNVFGWMNLEQVAKTVGLDIRSVIEASGLPEDTPTDISIKKIPGVNDEELKDALREYMQINSVSVTDRLPNPQEMRGSVTLNEISSEYMVGIKDLISELGLDGNVDLNIPVKDIFKSLGREVQEVREAIQKLMDKKP
ncbi:MAG: 4Fe-4S binding protein [Synergistaceae bacterium]|nr:4Fe-4S binding protein [Synergistaceae bacterium]